MFIRQVEPSKCSHYFISGDKVEMLFEINGKLLSSIPEIQDIKGMDRMPKEVLEKYDSVSIGRSIIQRHRSRNESDNNEPNPSYDFLNDTRIAQSFSAANIEGINNKCFLNQHDTATSKGVLNDNLRLNSEQTFVNKSFAGINTPEDRLKLNEVLPKYSYVLIDKYNRSMGLNKISAVYGNVIAIFNDVKARSTFTAGDSLVTRAQERTVHSYNYRPKNIISIDANGMYFENQTWGKLCFDDVSYFLVNCFEAIS